jgi:hypothetical protein
MMFQMLRDPGRMTAQMLLYRPRRFITRNVGISPPEKYIGTSR